MEKIIIIKIVPQTGPDGYYSRYCNEQPDTVSHDECLSIHALDIKHAFIAPQNEPGSEIGILKYT